MFIYKHITEPFIFESLPFLNPLDLISTFGCAGKHTTWVAVLERFMIVCATHTYFLSAEYVPTIVLGAGDIVASRLDKNPSPTEDLSILMGKIKSER